MTLSSPPVGRPSRAHHASEELSSQQATTSPGKLAAAPAGSATPTITPGAVAPPTASGQRQLQGPVPRGPSLPHDPDLAAVRRSAEEAARVRREALGLYRRLAEPERRALAQAAAAREGLRAACLHMPEAIDKSQKGYLELEDPTVQAALTALCDRLLALAAATDQGLGAARAALGKRAAALLPPDSHPDAVRAAVADFRAGGLPRFELVERLGHAWWPTPAVIPEVAIAGELASRARVLCRALAGLPKLDARRLRADRALLATLLGARTAAVFDTSRGQHTLERLVAVVDAVRRGTRLDLDVVPLGGGKVLVGEPRSMLRSAQDSPLSSVGYPGDADARARLRAAGDGRPDAATAAALAACPMDFGGAELPGAAALAAMADQAAAAVAAGQPPSLPEWPGRVRDVGIITYDRPDRLETALTSYVESLAAFNRSDVTITVFDDSSGEAAAANRRVVDAFAAQGHHVVYVGESTKQAILEAALARASTTLGWSAERTGAALAAALGHADGDLWRGGISSQRNWTALWYGGRRALLVDDDTYAATLVARDPHRAHTVAAVTRGLAAESRRLNRQDRADHRRHSGDGDATAAGEDHLSLADRLAAATPPGFAPQVIDILGAAERQPDVPTSAQAEGHVDYKAGVVLGSFLTADEGAAAWLTGDTPVRPLDTFDSGFRGSCYVSSTSLDGLDFTLRTGRDEDFTLAYTRQLTARRGIAPDAGAEFVHLHVRGARSSNQARALRQEGESAAFTQALSTLFARYFAAHPVFDAACFADEAAAALKDPTVLAHVAAAASDSRLQARTLVESAAAHLERLEKAHAALVHGKGPGIATEATPLYSRWYRARLAAVDPHWAARLELAGRAARRKDSPAGAARAVARVLREKADALGAELPGRDDFEAALRAKIDLTRQVLAELQAEFALGASEESYAAAMTDRLRTELSRYAEGMAAFSAVQAELPAALGGVASLRG